MKTNLSISDKSPSDKSPSHVIRVLDMYPLTNCHVQVKVINRVKRGDH